MSTGLLAILDDVSVIAKAAAASLDDASVQALAAGKKAAGVVIDDAAVTPRYVVGFAAQRELPIVGKIALGSLKNKLVFLLPAALGLSYFAPWLITPLLMLGGAYLCYEGFEKVLSLWHGQETSNAISEAAPEQGTALEIENRKVANAIRTDFILSAEIMAISLASITAPDFTTKAIVLALVGIFVTLGVYGAVALIVKADDAGIYLAQQGRLGATRAFGRGIVAAMPGLLKTLSIIGMLAMLWVGGGIILHGLEEYHLGALQHAIHDLGKAAGSVFGPASGTVMWIVEAAAAGVFGLVIGWVVATVAGWLGWGH